MRKSASILAVLVILVTGFVVAQGLTTLVELQFVTHLQAGLPEQDVFIERIAGSGEVYRVTAADQNMNAPLYATASPIKHNPFDPGDIGPYPQSRALGFTLGQWLAATGTGSYTCTGGQGRVEASFANLVPNATYTMWYFFLPTPPTQPHTGLDLPLGARDGSQATFHSDAEGNARFDVTLEPCLQLSGEQLASGLAINYHSDGQTYGSAPGSFGSAAHVQLFLSLPRPQ